MRRDGITRAQAVKKGTTTKLFAITALTAGALAGAALGFADAAAATPAGTAPAAVTISDGQPVQWFSPYPPPDPPAQQRVTGCAAARACSPVTGGRRAVTRFPDQRYR
jgi:hypothetical protein